MFGPPPALDLVHPVTVTIDPLDTASTRWDGSAREPVPRECRLPTVTITAQVHWTRRRDRQRTAAGPQDSSDGFLVFRRVDLTAQAYDPQPGDRVATITEAGVAVNVYLTTPGQRRGQYGGNFGLVRAFFEDRRPHQD